MIGDENLCADLLGETILESQPAIDDKMPDMQMQVEHTGEPAEPNIFLQRPVYGGLTESEISEGKTRVQTRIREIRAKMTIPEKKKTTFAVAWVKLEGGQTAMWISSAGKKGRVPQRVRGTDRVIKNKSADGNHENRLNDAEQTLIREAREEGAEIISIGATRAMCGKCEEVAEAEDIIHRVATQIKSRQIPRRGPVIKPQGLK